MQEQIVFTTEEGEEVLFYVLEETRVNGVNFILVTDSEDEEADCYIMRDTSSEGETEAVYEMVEDDGELEALMKIFAELLDEDTEIRK